MSTQLPDIPTPAPPDPGLVDKIYSLDIPTQQEFLGWLAALNAIQAILLLAAGLLCLLQGWKVFKVIVIVNAAILGTLAGGYLGRLLPGANTPLIAGLAGALLFGVLAWPLMKYAVSVMGGLVGAFLGYAVWLYAATAAGQEQIAAYAWAGALIGLIALGLLAFVIFRLVVEIFTAFQGALLTVAGIVALLLMHESLRDKLTGAFESNEYLLPLVICVPGVIGFAFQETAARKKRRKKMSGGGGGGDSG